MHQYQKRSSSPNLAAKAYQKKIADPEAHRDAEERIEAPPEIDRDIVAKHHSIQRKTLWSEWKLYNNRSWRYA
jgi:hypothetical protein